MLKITLSAFIFSHVAFVWASDYQQGFEAYINGDYSGAQKYWLNGAKANDAKSMFNLGLLHEQKRLPSASADKAMNWFSLAANNGYSAAAFHMAQRMLDRGGSDAQAIELINQSAEQGYAPARRYLGLALVNRASLSDQVPAQNATAVTNSSPNNSSPNNSSLSNGSSASAAWINRQPADNWTIQLLAFTQREKVDSFIKEHQLQYKAHYYTDIDNGQTFYKLVYGSFTSKEIADDVRNRLAPPLKQYGPWLRNWAAIHKTTQ